MIEYQSIFLALVMLAPLIVLSYRQQRDLNRKLIEAERSRDSRRDALIDECRAHGMLIHEVSTALDLLERPDGHDDPLEYPIDILRAALGRGDGGSGGGDTDWTDRAFDAQRKRDAYADGMLRPELPAPWTGGVGSHGARSPLRCGACGDEMQGAQTQVLLAWFSVGAYEQRLVDEVEIAKLQAEAEVQSSEITRLRELLAGQGVLDFGTAKP